jgi:hypothetical protein
MLLVPYQHRVLDHHRALYPRRVLFRRRVLFSRGSGLSHRGVGSSKTLGLS